MHCRRAKLAMCGGIMQDLHSQTIHTFQDLFKIVLGANCMWVCLLYGGGGGGEEFA